jgi:hypothetical protein
MPDGEILNAKIDALSNPDMIKVGQKLHIPACRGLVFMPGAAAWAVEHRPVHYGSHNLVSKPTENRRSARYRRRVAIGSSPQN